MTTIPAAVDPAPLADGEKPQLGVPYYVDVQIMSGHCSWIYLQFDGRWWWAEMSKDELAHWRSEEHTSERQSLMRISYAVFCLKKKNYTSPKTYEHVISI